MDKQKDASGLIYVYGVIPSREIEQQDVPAKEGIDHKPIYSLGVNELTAIVCPVTEREYSQQQVSQNINKTDWLREKAYHHHECIALLSEHFTILPLSFCTIFMNEYNLRQMLTERYPILLEKLNSLQQRQEWNLKVYCHAGSLSSSVSATNPAILQFQERMSQMPPGKQYLMKKQLQKLIAAEVEKEQGRRLEDLHRQLERVISDSVIGKNWGREVTQREDDMVYNCNYLVDQEKVQSFLRWIEEYQQIYQSNGWTFHVTGPWPPYHFSKLKREG